MTSQGSPSFVPIAERIATFDNDGTLWCEQPAPVQAYFALDRVKALASQHPEWKTQEPFASLLKGDLQATLAGGDHALLEIVMATHAGMTAVEFGRIVDEWIATAKHPETGRLCAAADEVFAGTVVSGLKMEAFSYYYIPSGAVGLAGIVARPHPELRKLQQALIDAVAPFTVATGTSEAFATTADDPVIDPLLIDYVSTFVQKSAGEHFSPHVTTGIALRDYLDKMIAEPFETFTFSPAGAAVYQLGQFGTAAKKLHGFSSTR